MTTRTDPWQNLVALARTVPDEPVPAADPVDDARFAARVVHRWTHPPLPAARGLPWETWSLRGLAAAGALAAVMLTWNLPLLNAADTPPDDVLPPDPVAELAASF